MNKTLNIVLGVLSLILGVIGIILPFVPGILFIGIGLYLLSTNKMEEKEK